MVPSVNRIGGYFFDTRLDSSTMAGRRKSWLSYFKLRRESQDDEEISPNFLKHGGALLQKLIATFGGRYKNPIHCFTAKQLTTATNHFADSVHKDAFQETFRGSLDGRSILVTKYTLPKIYTRSAATLVLDPAITNLVVSSQLSHRRNVLKFIGCCLEFEIPLLVYEAAGTRVLDDFFTSSNNDEFLPWKSRVRIAKDIASTLTYLHTAFSTPIIHRDVRLHNVVIDKCGNAKLFGFSCCISLPPGRKHVEDKVTGTLGYLDPEYFSSCQVTPKVDVYSFGILLLELLKGRLIKRPILGQIATINQIADHDTIDQIVDHKIWEAEEEIQFRAWMHLKVRCIQVKGEERPDMIDVAKELCRIEKNEPMSSSI